MIHYTVDEFVAQGDAVFMRGSTAWRNRRTGKTVDTPKVDFWRFENGNVPIQPAPYRGDTVVVVEGLKGAAPPAKTLTVEIAGMALSTPVVVVGPGSVLVLLALLLFAVNLFRRAPQAGAELLAASRNP